MNATQKHALENHRRRLGERGLARYEVRGLERDKDLVRRLAKRLAADDEAASRLRLTVAQRIAEEPPSGKAIWDALRRSPLSGLAPTFERDIGAGRDIEL